MEIQYGKIVRKWVSDIDTYIAHPGSTFWVRGDARVPLGHWKPGVLAGGKASSWAQPLTLSLRMCVKV